MGDGKRLRVREPIAALNRIRLCRSGEPLVDLRRACPGMRIGRKCVPFLRATVAEMLNRARTYLPAGHDLWARTALRSLQMQRDGYEGYSQQLQKDHPDWSYATLRRAANRFFAPPDQKAPPGHCTGGAVDVWLLAPTRGGRLKPADLTSPFKFPPRGDRHWQAVGTWAEGLALLARQNRMILYEAMTRAGFSNCEEEFWHYSYGDAAWAVRVGATYCVYGVAVAPAPWRKRHPEQGWSEG